MTRLLNRYKRELSVAAVYVAVLIALAVFAPSFFHDQLGNTFVQAAPILVAAVGMTLVIVAREIDISIGSQFSVCGVVAGLAAKAGWPVPAVLALTVLAGGAMGAINGALIALVELPSIVVTLATMVVLRESLRWARQGEAIRELPPNFQWFGLSQTAGEWMLVITAGVITFLFAWSARNLAAGRAVYAVGSDASAARLAGIRPKHVTFHTFLLLGVLVAIAAVMNAVRFPQVDVNTGLGMELQVIAAVVVGGTAINGGRGTMIGAVVGVMLLITVGPALSFLHQPPQWERAVQGVIILAAVASDRLFGRNA